MIEKTLLDYLSLKMDVPVHMEEPECPEPSYVILGKTGSRMRDHVCTATVVAQSYAETLYGAAVLNERVKQAMFDSVCLDEICSCDLNSDYNFTDQETHRYRYQAVFDITHY